MGIIERGVSIMEGPIMVLNGVNGQLELYLNKVVIKRKGVLAKMTQGFFKGDKEIYIKQLSGIQVKMGTSLTNGYIQFTLAGGNENTKGLLNATQDENSLVFSKKDNKTVNLIKGKIEDFMSAGSNPKISDASSAVDEIKKFKELFDAGILTEEEFNKLKELMR